MLGVGMTETSKHHAIKVELKRRERTVFSESITVALRFQEDGSISWEGVLRDVSGLKELREACLEAERQNRELSESERRIREFNQHILNMLINMYHDILYVTPCLNTGEPPVNGEQEQ